MPWVEKYRPRILDDVVGNDDTLVRLRAIAIDGNMPNLILCGPPGTGKVCALHSYICVIILLRLHHTSVPLRHWLCCTHSTHSFSLLSTLSHITNDSMIDHERACISKTITWYSIHQWCT